MASPSSRAQLFEEIERWAVTISESIQGLRSPGEGISALADLVEIARVRSEGGLLTKPDGAPLERRMR